MRSRFTTIALSLILAVTFSAAQQPPMVAVQSNTLHVSAEGRFEADPDTARVQFDISAQENAAKAAYERATESAEQVRQILRSNGIDPKQAEIGFFSLSPVYDYRTPKRKLVAYRVNSTVVLKLREFSKVGQIVQQLSDLDVTADQSLNYTLENMDAAKTRAVEDAFKRARGEADALARAGGRALGELSYGSVDTSEVVPVRPMMMARAESFGTAAKAPTEEFTPQRIVVTARVSALFALK